MDIYHVGVAAVTIGIGKTSVPSRIVGHVENHICQLGGLADRPIQQSNGVGRRNIGRVDDDVLHGNVEVHCAVLIRVLAIDDVIVREVAAGLQDRRIIGIAHQHGSNIELQRVLEEVCPAWDVNDGILTSSAHCVLGP